MTVPSNRFGSPRKFLNRSYLQSCFPTVNSRSLLSFCISDRSACHRGQSALNLNSSVIDDLEVGLEAFDLFCYLILLL